MALRIFVGVLAVFLGSAVALAQSDPSVRPADASGAQAKAKSGGKSGSKSSRRHAPAAAKSKDKSKEKTGAKEKSKDADTKAAEKKPAEKKADKKEEAKESKPKAKPDPAEKDQAAASKQKSKSSDDKPATSGSATAVTPEEKRSLREAYAAIPLADRLALQSDLIWTGDYNGLIDGQFSDRLVEAVNDYQKRQKSKATGVLNAAERTALAATVRPRQEEVGWRLAEDPVTAARVGLPGKIATRVTPGASGTRWSSAQGQLQIETFRIDTGATLEAVFEQQQKLPRRRTTYKVMRADFFVVSGTQGLKKFYVRAFARDGEVRGLTILYDQAMEGTMDPIVVAMSSAFVPFASFTVAGKNDVPRRRIEYGTGLVVTASGHIVTARNLIDGCHVIAIPGLGDAERLAEDKETGLALLRVYGLHRLKPIGLLGAAPEGDNVTLVGIADPQSQGGGSAISTAPSRVAARGTVRALESAPALGFSGAAALDSQGRFLGVAVVNPSVVAGTASAPQATVVPLERIRNFLELNYVAPASGRPGVEDTKASVVRVICVRK